MFYMSPKVHYLHNHLLNGEDMKRAMIKYYDYVLIFEVVFLQWIMEKIIKLLKAVEEELSFTMMSPYKKLWN